MKRIVLLTVASVALAALPASGSVSILHAHRISAGDLEVGGMLAGQPPGSTRYIRYNDLLNLPQESYKVTDDSNFTGPTEIGGVALEALAHLLGNAPDDSLVVAICYDKYRTNYPRDYVAAHHPLLVLRINGQLRDRWPPSKKGGSLGPYLISHPFFKPSFKILSHDDELQIPFGVTRIEVRRESAVFGAIQPPGRWPENPNVEQGYMIARQDCFRCHNMGAEGGTMAGRSWLTLAESAHRDPSKFRQTIRNPASVNPKTKMPAQPDYDDATLNALAAYFNTFAVRERNE